MRFGKIRLRGVVSEGRSEGLGHKTTGDGCKYEIHTVTRTGSQMIRRSEQHAGGT